MSIPAPKIAQVLVDAIVTAEPGCHFRYSDSLVWQVVPIEERNFTEGEENTDGPDD
jgi:hypothetical protein